MSNKEKIELFQQAQEEALFWLESTIDVENPQLVGFTVPRYSDLGIWNFLYHTDKNLYRVTIRQQYLQNNTQNSNDFTLHWRIVSVLPETDTAKKSVN